jgi:hypothetical protein
LRDNRHTFVYVPDAKDGVDGHSDIHIVELKYTYYSDTPYEYRIRDWENIFGRMSKDQEKRRWVESDRTPNELNGEIECRSFKDVENNADA